jgi:hypothetical protein
MLIVSPKPYEGFRGCFITYANNMPRISYTLLVFMETGELQGCTSMFHVGPYACKELMVLMVISAYKS